LIRCCLEAVSHKGRQGVALRVLEILGPAPVNDKHHSSRVSTLIAGELLKTASGNVSMHGLHESVPYTTSLRALLSTSMVPADGYIIRGLPRDKLKAEITGDARVLRTIRNLAPEHLAVTDWMDLSLQAYPLLHVIDEALGTRCLLSQILYTPRRAEVRSIFPPGTSGFLYVHVPEPAHPIGAQLRFRLVPMPDPAGFDAGHDLRTPAGMVWQHCLPALVRNAGGDILAGIVARQGLVSQTVVDRWQSGDNKLKAIRSTSNMVCPGSEPLVWNLVKDRARVMLGTGARACLAQVSSPFVVKMADNTKRAPFEGDDPCSLEYLPSADDTLSSGQVIVRLEENHEKQTYAVRVVEVSNLRVHPLPGRRMPPTPEQGALVHASFGRRLYAMVQEMREREAHEHLVSK
jgi:hypothetical protein